MTPKPRAVDRRSPRDAASKRPALKAERPEEPDARPACPRCHLIVARYAPQVVDGQWTCHKECYEAWYVSRHGRRPVLTATSAGGHVFAVAKGAGA